MKKFIPIFFALFITLWCSAQETQWAVSAGGAASDKGINIGMDDDGYIYIGGYFNDTAYFGPHMVTSTGTWGGDKDFFVAKMDTNGNFLWVNTGGCGADDRMLGMHVDGDGYVYCVGKTWSSVNFGGAPVNGVGGYEQSFIAKMDNNGNWLWAKLYGAPSGGTFSQPFSPYTIMIGDDHCYDVETDELGNIYVTGFWSNVDAYFDDDTLTNPAWATDTNTMAYVGKLDPNGNFLWVRKFDGVNDKVGARDNRLALDNDANVYITGGFENRGAYGDDTLTSTGGWDIFVTKLDSTGNFQWARRAGSVKDDRGNGVAIAPDGDIYIGGEFKEAADFGNDSLNHKNRKDIFVAKLKPNGDWKWAKRAKKSSGKDRANQMTVDQYENVLITGEVGDTIKFGDIIINSPYNDQNALVAMISKNGKWQWAKVATGGLSGDRTNNVLVDNKGNCYAIGYFEGTADFDGFSLTSEGKKDIFVWKIRYPMTEPEEPLVTGIKGVHVPDAFSPNQDGNNDFLYVYGGQIVKLSMAVYDRWGEQVFYTSNKDRGWDGTFNGKKCNSGVYVYVVKAFFTDGESEVLKGNVTLVR